MYNKEKFAYLEVEMDKDDYAIVDMMMDLKSWCEHLYPVAGNESVTVIRYKGLVPLREVRFLDELIQMSPYGDGYRVTMDGTNMYDPVNVDRFACAW